ncbi:MAG: hypothetical protein KF809_17955 [Chloroflexi bacterium]|nr:hypothetical protein [Chloroflexota bacterium]
MHDRHDTPSDPSEEQGSRQAPTSVQGSRSRRSFLGAAVAALGAVAVQSVANVAPVEAANGSTVKAGKTTTATAFTTIKNTKKGGTALVGRASNKTAANVGVQGRADGPSGVGVRGQAPGSEAYGVYGVAPYGVVGNGKVTGVVGFGPTGIVGDAGTASGTVGVYGRGRTAVRGSTTTGIAVEGKATGASGIGVYGEGPHNGYGAYFTGKVHVAGDFSATSKAFLIDHPLDPANRYLAHSNVESPDMLNVYSGSVTLNAKGRATVRLPRYFEVLNSDHRYQLTAIGAAAPGLHIARKVEGNRFVIAGGPAGLEVCWQVTGVRQDAYAKQHRVKVDTAKKPRDKGRYLEPEAHGKQRADGIGYAMAPETARG